MPYRTVTKIAWRNRTKKRDIIKQDRLGYTEIEIHRPKIIYFEFEGMRANTPHWIFFGNKEVTKYCNTSYTLSDYTTAARNSNIKEPGDNYVSETGFPTALGGATNGGGATPLTSGADGSIRGFFYLQSNTTDNFKLNTDGTSFSALDISVLDQDETLSYASTKFYGMGQYENWYQYSVSEAKTFSEKYSYQTQVYYENSSSSSSGNDDNTGPTPISSGWKNNDPSTGVYQNTYASSNTSSSNTTSSNTTSTTDTSIGWTNYSVNDDTYGLGVG